MLSSFLYIHACNIVWLSVQTRVFSSHIFVANADACIKALKVLNVVVICKSENQGLYFSICTNRRFVWARIVWRVCRDYRRWQCNLPSSHVNVEVLSVISYIFGVAAYRAKIVVLLILYIYVHLNKWKKKREGTMQQLQVQGLSPAWYLVFERIQQCFEKHCQLSSSVKELHKKLRTSYSARCFNFSTLRHILQAWVVRRWRDARCGLWDRRSKLSSRSSLRNWRHRVVLCGFAAQYQRPCYTLPFFVACCVVMCDNRRAN